MLTSLTLELRRNIKWLYGLGVMCLLLATASFITRQDQRKALAVVTAKSEESRSYDLSSLASLAALSTGGNSPTFEEFGFLIKSEVNIRKAMPTIMRAEPKLAHDLFHIGFISRVVVGFDNIMRTVFGKSSKTIDPSEIFVAHLRKSLSVRNTTEGYLKIEFKSGLHTKPQILIQTLAETADTTLRLKARAQYGARLKALQSLLDQTQRATERAVISNLIAREYATYVASQLNQAFAFQYVEPPLRSVIDYAPSFIATYIIASVVALMLYLGLCFTLAWVRTSD